MSHQRLRSPLQSRPSTHGRRDAYYGEQYHAHSGPWRSSENVDNRNTESGVCWDNGSSQAEEQVDHWAKFIDAIGRAEKRKAASMSRCHAQDGIQDFRQDSARSPRQPRERLSSPEALQFSMETHQRIQSPGHRRNEHDDAHVDRRYSRSSSPRHLQGRRIHDRMEHGYQNEEHEDRRERSTYSERSLKSNYMEPHLHFKQSEDLDPQEEYTVSHRGFSPHRAPVVVEHGHGIPKHDARSHNPGRERERPTSRDSARERGDPRNHGPSRGRERPRSRELVRDQEHSRFGDPVRAREHPRSHDPVAQRGHPRSHDPVAQRGHPRSHDPVAQLGHPRSHDPVAQLGHPRSHDPVAQQGHPRSHDPGRDREFPRGSGPCKHQEHPRSRDILRTSDLPRDRDYPKSSELQRGGDPTIRRESSRSNELRQREGDYNQQPGTSRDGHSGSLNYHIREDSGFHTSSAERWREEMHPRGNRDGVLGQGNVLKESQHRNANHPGARMDFASHETLKIKVDMSRPVGQSSHLGYSSERQLSLDLVNVGRQRLDFLPMLDHSGTFTETAMHSGTFAQEIITLVHHVKENYFQGQDMTLNERFSNEQEYSLTDEFAEDEQEMENLGPIINRPHGSTSSDMQIFCKIGPLQSQRKPHVPAPGDLRHDLERKRQEKLEGVKITIAGQNFSQILPQSLEIESVYAGDEPREASWSNDEPCEASWSNDEPREASWSNDEPREASWSNDERREASWSNDEPRQPEHWQDAPRPKRPSPNYNSRWRLKRDRHRQGARMKRNPSKGARW